MAHTVKLRRIFPICPTPVASFLRLSGLLGRLAAFLLGHEFHGDSPGIYQIATISTRQSRSIHGNLHHLCSDLSIGAVQKNPYVESR